MKQYMVNEIFYSLQGEGARAGSANVFVRFAGCNLECRMEAGEKSPGGFDCDTEFASGRKLTADEIVAEILGRMPAMTAVILTGGEPLLQADAELIMALRKAQTFVAIETNGTFPIPSTVDWVSCSPKVAEHALKIDKAHEVRYVRHEGQGIPKPRIEAFSKFLSPAWAPGEMFGRNLAWCIKLVKENPTWKLSTQQHKLWGVR